MKNIYEIDKKQYIPTEEEIEKCRKFANDCAPTNRGEYARRNQTNMDKIRMDIMVGKLAEIAVWKLMNEKTTEPDFEIYTRETKKKKSFEADLTDENGKSIHVKSQCIEQAKRFETSWMFQKSDPLDDDGVCVFTVVGDESMGYPVKVFHVLPTELVDGYFEEPKSWKLKESKKTIYYKTIKHLSEETLEDY